MSHTNIAAFVILSLSLRRVVGILLKLTFALLS